MTDLELHLQEQLTFKEDAIDTAIKFLNRHDYALAAIVLIGTKGFQALQDAEREAEQFPPAGKHKPPRMQTTRGPSIHDANPLPGDFLYEKIKG